MELWSRPMLGPITKVDVTLLTLCFLTRLLCWSDIHIHVTVATVYSCDVPSLAQGWTPDRAADEEQPCSPELSSSSSPSPGVPAAPCGTETGEGWAVVYWYMAFQSSQNSVNNQNTVEKDLGSLMVLILFCSETRNCWDIKQWPHCPLTVTVAMVAAVFLMPLVVFIGQWGAVKHHPGL